MMKMAEQFSRLRYGSVLLIILSLSWLLTGCDSLPPGQAPTGPIIAGHRFGGSTLDIEQAIEYMTTSLTAALIRHNLRHKVIDKVFTDSYSNRVFVQTATVTGIKAASGEALSELALRSKFIKNDNGLQWVMQLINLKNSRIVWQEQLTIHP